MPLTITISENSWFARVAAWRLAANNVAIVFGKKIYLHNCTSSAFLADKKWLCHEVQHVLQYQRLGIIKFLFLYLFYSLRYGYRKNPFEIEARENEENYRLLENLKVITN